MKTQRILAIGFLATLVLPLAAEEKKIPNPAIDYEEFARLSTALASVREKNRLTEEQFLKMAAEPGTVILDVRSPADFRRIHVKGARNLPLTDFTDASLAKLIPDKRSRILIYCNNNFSGQPGFFPTKRAAVALNVQSFVNLHAYGYTNVHELGPYLNVQTTRIILETGEILVVP
ncbi:MAG: rhodanese-like domain-containing protein [Verrucomicrobiaceae bacterium]|nr:MAG: rhodanese-like domain-containing protein [Verrucomicrobiaceae bacterium]